MRRNHKNSQYETFGYDKLDRLNCFIAGIAGGAAYERSFRYSPNGNITSTTQQGTYQYNAGKPYAVNKITTGGANPATTQLHIKLSSQEPANYAVYNLMGQTVLQGRLQDDAIINVQSLANGVYLLKIDGKENDAMVKFVKR